MMSVEEGEEGEGEVDREPGEDGDAERGDIERRELGEVGNGIGAGVSYVK